MADLDGLQDYERLLDMYTSWLRDRSRVRRVADDGWVEISTPFLDRHNDHVQIYARRLGDNDFELTDDGNTIQDLRMDGCELDTDRRQWFLGLTVRGFGIDLTTDEQLSVRANAEDFPRKTHGLVQAIIGINDLFLTSQPNVQTFFKEDVQAWLTASEVRFSPSVKFTGKSGFDHYFDFVIPATPGKAGERFLRALNSVDREKAGYYVFQWGDLRETRGPDAAAFAIINDEEQKPRESVLKALRGYDITPVLYSQRQDVVHTLAA